MKASKTWRRIGLALLAGLFSLVLAEAALRACGVRPHVDRLELYEFDTTLGWRTRKAWRCYRSSLWYWHFTYYDLSGFPTDRHNWANSLSPEKSTIAFIGDSYVEGYYLPYEMTFTHLVGRAFPDRQILNLGVSGYSPDQYLLAARQHLSNYNVTAIVVVFFPYNDIPYVTVDHYHRYTKPLFRRSLDSPVNLPLKRKKRPAKRGLMPFLTSHSAVVFLIAPLWEHTQVKTPPENLRYSEAGMHSAMRFIRQIRIENPAKPFLVYYLPRYEETLDPTLLGPNLRLFKRICAEMNLCGASPERVFTEQCNPREFYRPGEGHLTATGARHVAEHLCSLLRTNMTGRASGDGAVSPNETHVRPLTPARDML